MTQSSQHIPAPDGRPIVPAASSVFPPASASHAVDDFSAALYADLRRLAAAHLRDERANHTLQPTALVHEAYLRLARQHVHFSDRPQFIAHASSMMRRILVDHARAKHADKRGGAMTQVTLSEAISGGSDNSVDLLALDAAMQRLFRIEPDQARIVELRFFGGLSVGETAAIMNIGKRSVDREWACARAWLFRELGGDAAPA